MSKQFNWELTKRIFVYNEPISMSNAFRGLAEIVKKKLMRDPASGELFVFSNKRRKYLKILSWSNGGWVILSKKLPHGSFSEKLWTQKTLTPTEMQKIVDTVLDEEVQIEE